MSVAAGFNLRIEGARLMSRIAAMGEIGDTGDGGACRLALTEEDRLGRDLLVGWMRELGMRVEIDRIGNIIGLWPGDLDAAPVMCGSHVDTVATGGRYDGVYGVLAGLEVVETLQRAGIRPARPIAVAAFTNEEGARFQPDMLGSLVYAGGLGIDEARAARAVDDGTPLGQALDVLGYAGALEPGAIRPHAYLELHIEQGPVLDAEGIAIGAVADLQGISWSELVLTGAANHAGTTPMGMRQDAGLAAAEIAAAAGRLAREAGGGQVATVGRMEFEPNVINVIPRRVLMTLDLRNPDPARFAEAERNMEREARAIAARHGCGLEIRSLARFEPVRFDEGLVARIEAAAGRLGLSRRRMTSGAGHDAQMLARICPAAMIFTPSRAGISHNPAEFTPPEQLEQGANVLLAVVMELAG